MKPILIIAAAQAFFLLSCSSPKHDEMQNASAEAPVSEDSRDKFNKLLAGIDSPVEVIATVEKAKIKYDPFLLPPLKKDFEFVSSTKKSLNYGALMVTLSYLSLFEHNQEMINYIALARKLAQELKAGDAFEKVINARFEKNISDRDSLAAILRAAYNGTNQYLISNERLNSAATVFAGSWVESVFIGLNALKSVGLHEGTQALVGKIYKEKQGLINLLELLHDFKNDDEIKLMILELESFQKLLNTWTNKSSLSSKQLTELADKIKEIRGKMIAV